MKLLYTVYYVLFTFLTKVVDIDKGLDLIIELTLLSSNKGEASNLELWIPAGKFQNRALHGDLVAVCLPVGILSFLIAYMYERITT